MSADKIHFAALGRLAKLPVDPITEPNAIPALPNAESTPVTTVTKSNPNKASASIDIIADIRKIAKNTKTPDVISSVRGRPLYFAMKTPCGKSLCRKYCTENR